MSRILSNGGRLGRMLVGEAGVSANKAIQHQKGRSIGGVVRDFIDDTADRFGVDGSALYRNLLPEEGSLGGSRQISAKLGMEDTKVAQDILSKRKASVAERMGNSEAGSTAFSKAQAELNALNMHDKSLTDAMASGNGYEGVVNREKGLIDKTIGYFKADDLGGDTGARITRGVAAGAGVVGARLASGGSLTRNANGESDIVGVPLI